MGTKFSNVSVNEIGNPRKPVQMNPAKKNLQNCRYLSEEMIVEVRPSLNGEQLQRLLCPESSIFTASEGNMQNYYEQRGR